MTTALANLRRGFTTGALATAAMTLTTALERRSRDTGDGPVDYDASDHVVTAVETVLRRPARSRTEERLYFALAHWGYGSSVACAYGPVRRRMRSDAAAGGVFLVGCQAMAMTLFPLVGGTPPPHRWRRDLVVSSVVQHVVYVAVVVAVERRRSHP